MSGDFAIDRAVEYSEITAYEERMKNRCAHSVVCLLLFLIPLYALRVNSAPVQSSTRQASASPKFNCTVFCEVNGKQLPVDREKEFREGDRVWFSVRPERNGFLYVIMRDDDLHKSSLVYPNGDAANNKVRSGEEFSVPSPYIFGSSIGTKKILFVVADNELKPEAVLEEARNATFDVEFSPTGKVVTEKISTDPKGSRVVVTKNFFCAALLLNQISRHATPIPKSTDKDKPVTDKWALIVGVDKFSGKSGVRPLRFAANDAKRFADFLIKEGNFAADHVLVLTDEMASRKKILDSLCYRWLPSVVRSDDLVLFYMASHGTPAVTDGDGGNYLVTHDFDDKNPFESGIQMQSLGALIKDHLPSNRVVIIVDTCFSGNIEPKVTGQPPSQLLRLFQGAGQVVVSACSPYQSSIEDKGGGIFTSALINGLRSEDNLEDAFKVASAEVRRVSWERFKSVQDPDINYKKLEGSDYQITVKPAAPRVIGRPEKLQRKP